MSIETYYNTSSMIRSVIDFNNEDQSLWNYLRDKIKEYEANVWSDGLQDIVEGDPHRGMIGELGDHVKLMTYVLAGRVMTTFQHEDGHSVTVLSGEGEKPSRMGLHGINGTIQQAHEFLELGCTTWKKNGILMKPNIKIIPDVLLESHPGSNIVA